MHLPRFFFQFALVWNRKLKKKRTLGNDFTECTYARCRCTYTFTKNTKKQGKTQWNYTQHHNLYKYNNVSTTLSLCCVVCDWQKTDVIVSLRFAMISCADDHQSITSVLLNWWTFNWSSFFVFVLQCERLCSGFLQRLSHLSAEIQVNGRDICSLIHLSLWQNKRTNFFWFYTQSQRTNDSKKCMCARVTNDHERWQRNGTTPMTVIHDFVSLNRYVVIASGENSKQKPSSSFHFPYNTYIRLTAMLRAFCFNSYLFWLSFLLLFIHFFSIFITFFLHFTHLVFFFVFCFNSFAVLLFVFGSTAYTRHIRIHKCFQSQTNLQTANIVKFIIIIEREPYGSDLMPSLLPSLSSQ